MTGPVSAATPARPDEPEPIRAVPLRRPGRVVAAIVVLVVFGLLIYGAATNSSYKWATYWHYLFNHAILSGLLVTIELTVIAMAIGIVLGIVLAVMRLTGNPVLTTVAWIYLWIFRGTPVYVQLVFWGLFTALYSHLRIGIPWGPTFWQLDISRWHGYFVLAFIGLGLNEAAYMAEIVRAGINSVGEGQTEAACALGMSWTQTMRRVVLPQAMRVIIPPTGNEVISMLKTTSLVVAVPVSTDLYNQSVQIAGVNFQPIPLLMDAATWYLVATSVLMVGQYFLEKRFARGSTRQMTTQQAQAMVEALTAQRGGGGAK